MSDFLYVTSRCRSVADWVGIEGPCLHRPGNGLERQLNDEPKPAYKVGFIRKERKRYS
jgi:hypothetical protein